MQQDLQVETSELDEFASKLGDVAKTIDDALDTLDTAVGKVIGQWDGDAQLAYYRAQTNWTRMMTELQGIIARSETELSGISANYSATDSKIAGTFNF